MRLEKAEKLVEMVETFASWQREWSDSYVWRATTVEWEEGKCSVDIDCRDVNDAALLFVLLHSSSNFRVVLKQSIVHIN